MWFPVRAGGVLPADTYPWLWDVDMDAATFRRLLRGEGEAPGRDWRWAMLRLVEYAPYRDVCRLLPREWFLAHWPEVAARVRAKSIREGMDYLHARLEERREKAGG